MNDSVARSAVEPDLSPNPIFGDFVHKHSDYLRIHVNLNGLFSANDSTNENALQKRRNRLGAVKVFDATPDPYVVVEAIGSDAGGSTDYFPIGKHKFQTLKDSQIPVWDSKTILLCQKDAFQGLKLSVLDENGKRSDEALFTVELSKDELPGVTRIADATWTAFEKPATSGDTAANTVLDFSVMITEGDDRIVTKADMDAVLNISEDTAADYGLEGYEYSEVVLSDGQESCEDGKHSLLQCWKHEESTKAVLWILGRNDCFMHPHVAKELYWGQGYDVYVLNYKLNGLCRKYGWVADPHYNSHNPSGNFDVYNADIGDAIAQIQSKEYEKVLGYAHSTGGPILLNYLMAHGDDAFDGFLFNSPFMDWGFVGGDLFEFALENTHVMRVMPGKTFDSKEGVATTPEGTDPINYMGQEVVLGDWAARMWTLYYFDWGARPLYSVPMTVGFAEGVTGVHKKMEARYNEKKPITAKPFLCITSRGDDVLKAPETLTRADWIGPSRAEIELNDNGHDIFLSYDVEDVDMAIKMCDVWLKNKKL